MRTLGRPVALIAASVLAACVGNIGDGGGDAPKGPGEGQSPICTAGQAGPAPLRRLTRTEYNRTAFDLLHDASNPADGFAVDATVGVFKNNTNSPVTALLATQYMEAADALSTTAAASLD